MHGQHYGHGKHKTQGCKVYQHDQQLRQVEQELAQNEDFSKLKNNQQYDNHTHMLFIDYLIIYGNSVNIIRSATHKKTYV